MILEQSEHVIQEVKKAFMGKDDIIRRVLATIYAGGHILLEDSPGVGKNHPCPCLFKSTGTGLQENTVYNRYPAVRYYRFYHVQPPE